VACVQLHGPEVLQVACGEPGMNRGDARLLHGGRQEAEPLGRIGEAIHHMTDVHADRAGGHGHGRWRSAQLTGQRRTGHLRDRLVEDGARRGIRAHHVGLVAELLLGNARVMEHLLDARRELLAELLLGLWRLVARLRELLLDGIPHLRDRQRHFREGHDVVARDGGHRGCRSGRGLLGQARRRSRERKQRDRRAKATRKEQRHFELLQLLHRGSGLAGSRTAEGSARPNASRWTGPRPGR